MKHRWMASISGPSRHHLRSFLHFLARCQRCRPHLLACSIASTRRRASESRRELCRCEASVWRAPIFDSSPRERRFLFVCLFVALATGLRGPALRDLRLGGSERWRPMLSGQLSFVKCVEVQRYLMCKSISSLVIAASALISSYKDEIEVFVMLALWWMKVPLTVVWLPGAVSDLGGRSGAWSRSSPTSFQT